MWRELVYHQEYLTHTVLEGGHQCPAMCMCEYIRVSEVGFLLFAHVLITYTCTCKDVHSVLTVCALFKRQSQAMPTMIHVYTFHSIHILRSPRQQQPPKCMCTLWNFPGVTTET